MMFWDQFDEYDSHSLRCVKQVSEKMKDHRLEKCKSKFLITTKECKIRVIRPRRHMETCQKYLQAERKGQSHIPFACRGVSFGGRIQNKTRGKRVCCKFRSMHEHGLEERL